MWEIKELNEEQEKILRFLSEYTEGVLYEAEQEKNSLKSQKRYNEYTGMREIINALIDDIK